MPSDTTDDLASDILRGAEAIGTFLGVTPRRASYLTTEHHLIPYAKEGATIISRKSWLRAHYGSPVENNNRKEDEPPHGSPKTHEQKGHTQWTS